MEIMRDLAYEYEERKGGGGEGGEGGGGAISSFSDAFSTSVWPTHRTYGAVIDAWARSEEPRLTGPDDENDDIDGAAAAAGDGDADTEEVKVDKGREALRVLNEMKGRFEAGDEGCAPTVVAYTSALDAIDRSRPPPPTSDDDNEYQHDEDPLDVVLTLYSEARSLSSGDGGKFGTADHVFYKTAIRAVSSSFSSASSSTSSLSSSSEEHAKKRRDALELVFDDACSDGRVSRSVLGGADDRRPPGRAGTIVGREGGRRIGVGGEVTRPPRGLVPSRSGRIEG